MIKYLLLSMVLAPLIWTGCCKEPVKPSNCSANQNNKLVGKSFTGEVDSRIFGYLDYEKVYYTINDLYNDTSFYVNSIPLPINFRGVCLLKGVTIDYGNYAIDRTLTIDTCAHTLEIFNKYKPTVNSIQVPGVVGSASSLVLVDSIDRTYQITFRTEIVPF
jgi:hypothetical protein